MNYGTPYGQPAYGQPQPMGYGGYQQPQQQQPDAQYTAYFLNLAREKLSASMAAGGVDMNTSNLILSSLDPNMAGRMPQVNQNIQTFLSFISTECAKMGSNDPIRTRSDIFDRIIDAYGQRTVAQIYQQAQQQQMQYGQPQMMGGGYGGAQGYTGGGYGYNTNVVQGQGYGQPAQPAGPVYRRPGQNAPQTNGGYPTQPQVAQAQSQPQQQGVTGDAYRRPGQGQGHQNTYPQNQPTGAAPQATAQAAPPPPNPNGGYPMTVTPSLPEIDLSVVEIDAPLKESLKATGLIEARSRSHEFHVGLDTDIDSTTLRTTTGAYNTDEEVLEQVGEILPEELLKGEFTHVIEYHKLETLKIAASKFKEIREVYQAQRSGGDSAIDALLEVLDDRTRGEYAQFDKLFTKLINSGLSTYLRASKAPTFTLAIEGLDDIATLLEGGWNGPVRELKNWDDVCRAVITNTIEMVMDKATFVETPESEHLADLVRADGVTYAINGLTKYDLVTSSGADKVALAGAILSEYTVLRINQSVAVSNNLNTQDLQKPILSSDHIEQANEVVFGVTLTYSRKFGASAKYPLHKVYFVQGNDVSKDTIIGTRLIARMNDVNKIYFL